MSNHLNKLIFLFCIVISQVAYASSDLDKSQIIPKSINDIVQLIDKANVDEKSIEASIKLVNATLPANSSKSQSYAFYYYQALAAEKLGMSSKRLESLQKGLNYINLGTFEEFYLVPEISITQLSIGNTSNITEQLKKTLSKIPARNAGASLNIEVVLVRICSEIGDFECAKKYLRDADASFTATRSYQNDSEYGGGRKFNFYTANAEYFYYQGKFEDSSIAYKNAIEPYEPWIEGLQDIPPGTRGFNSHPEQARIKLEQAYIKLSDSLLKIRKVNESEYYAREALKKSLSRSGKASLATSNALRQLAIVMLARDRNKDAIYLLTEAINGLKKADVPPESVDLSKVYKTLASAYIADGRFTDALKVLGNLEVTIKTYPEVSRFVDINSLDRVLALVRVGDLSQAESRARDFLGVTEKRTGQKSKETADAKLMLAMVLASQKKDDEARKLFVTGMGELITLEREVATDSEGLSSKEKKYLAAYIESYLGVLARAYEKSPTLAIASEAFVLGDLARSSSVQKALNASTARANITNPRLAELARKEQDLNQQITFLTRFSKELAMQPSNMQLPEVQKKMRNDVEQLRQEAKAVFRSIEIDFPEYAELISPKPASLDRVQKNLKSNEVLVTWFIGQSGSYVWAVSATGAPQFKALSLSQVNLRKNISSLRKSLDPQVSMVEEIPAFNFALSHQLYKSLIDPVQSMFDGKNTLVLVPHDEIGQLPMGVLTTNNFVLNPNADLRFSNYRDAPWLIKKYALVTVPSATALTSLRSLPKPKEGRLDYIAFGDPLFNVEQAKASEKVITKLSVGTQLSSRGVALKLRSSPNTAQVSSAEVSILPRLPDTNEEIEEIAKVFNVDPKRDIYLQKRANLDEVLKANLANRKVVMFSTHGLVPGELNGLTQPALALTNPEVLGQKGDGLLKVDQILTLKLNADWVVLSACNTAAGEGDGAEALSGLGRAFFYAGARSLLVSSWPVDSQASRKLMTDLFKRQNQDKTISKPQALQQASLQLLSQGQPDAKEESYSYAHPLFWAPFMMVGD
jgi:CHAT domain-containing protein